MNSPGVICTLLAAATLGAEAHGGFAGAATAVALRPGAVRGATIGRPNVTVSRTRYQAGFRPGVATTTRGVALAQQQAAVARAVAARANLGRDSFGLVGVSGVSRRVVTTVPRSYGVAVGRNAYHAGGAVWWSQRGVATRLPIYARPGWANVSPVVVSPFNRGWSNQVAAIAAQQQALNAASSAHARAWAYNVRRGWGHTHYQQNWFGPQWWASHQHTTAAWHYRYAFNNHSWSYWWQAQNFNTCANWIGVPASAYAGVWRQPVYYDYGPGGNVAYQNGSVYLAGQPVGTVDQFAQSAALLATVAPPASQAEAVSTEWLPLGTFAVAAGRQDAAPTRVVQLAVDRRGVVAGTWYNSATDQTQTIQGRVDPATQRVAFRIGGSPDLVAETGVYNLTQQEAPMLVHFGVARVEQYLLIRLDHPEGGAQGAAQQGFPAAELP